MSVVGGLWVIHKQLVVIVHGGLSARVLSCVLSISPAPGTVITSSLILRLRGEMDAAVTELSSMKSAEFDRSARSLHHQDVSTAK